VATMPRTRTEPRPAPSEEVTQAARQRFVRRQWARRWLRWRGVLVALLALVLVAGTLWLFLASSVLAVSGVQVDGVSVLKPSQVRRAAAVPTGEPLARVDLRAIAKRVRRLAAVRDVDVSRAWPHQVRIDVTERVPVAVVEQGGKIEGLDAQGVVFRQYSRRPAGLPAVHLGQQVRPDALAEVARVVGVLPAHLAKKVAFVEADTVDAISLQLRDGRRVTWGSADDSHDKARVVAVLLRQKASTYDVSVPGQPTIRP
jgi:cell division protein FtsQ